MSVLLREMAEQAIADSLRDSVRDPNAFSPFYEEYAEQILTYIAKRVYDVETAVDLMAEVFAKAFLKRRDFRGSTDAEARGWLYTIASREITDYFRRSKVELRAVQRLAMQIPRATEEDQARIIELAGLDELRGAIQLELDRLSPEQRNAVRLRIVEELPYDEVAQQLGISQEAARARVARGLRTLSKALERFQPPLKEGLA